MGRKPVQIFVLLLSIICIISGVWILIRDFTFFITKREANANILAVESTSSRIKVQLSYFNEFLKKEVTSSVFLKNSYKNELNSLGENPTIFYSKFYPKHIYIKRLKVIKKGILVFEVLFILIMVLAFMFGMDGLRKKYS